MHKNWISLQNRHFSFVLLIVSVSLIGFGCQRPVSPTNNSVEIDRQEILSEARKSGLIMDETEILLMTEGSALQPTSGSNPSDISDDLSRETAKWQSAALADVTGGSSFGLAFSKWESGNFTLIAKVGNLPVVSEGEQYVGWFVKRGEPLRVMNVGSVVPAGDQFAIVFTSQTDLSDYDFFVLTREQQDDNPQPSREHILEGSFR